MINPNQSLKQKKWFGFIQYGGDYWTRTSGLMRVKSKMGSVLPTFQGIQQGVQRSENFPKRIVSGFRPLLEPSVVFLWSGFGAAFPAEPQLSQSLRPSPKQGRGFPRPPLKWRFLWSAPFSPSAFLVTIGFGYAAGHAVW